MTVIVLSAVCALLAGFVLGWAASAYAHQRRRGAERDALGAVLQQLAANELERSTQRWQQLGDEKEKLLKEQLAGHEKALTALLTPLADKIKEYDQQRQEAFGRLANEMTRVTAANELLRQETAQLSKALSQPQARGRWGELTLRRVVELAGMTARVDFNEQVSIKGEDERSRPDMLISMPSGRSVVVDAKVPLDAYLQACEQSDSAQRDQLLAQHARKMREMVNRLSAKAYWEKIEGAPDFVVMFVPGDQFLSAALAQDQALLDDALAKRVVIATPSTLLALLRVVAEGWRAAALETNARAISALGVELYSRFNVLIGHLAKIRQGLEQAIKAFNSAVSSLEGRLLPQLRRFRELHADDGNEPAHLGAIDSPLSSLPEEEEQ